MTKYNRKCVICGKEYSYCTHGCSKDLNKPTWMANYDTDNCRQICNLFTRNTISKSINDEYVRNELNKLDLSGIDNIVPKVREWIIKINGSIANEEIKVIEEKENFEDEKIDTEEVSLEEDFGDEPVG